MTDVRLCSTMILLLAISYCNGFSAPHHRVGLAPVALRPLRTSAPAHASLATTALATKVAPAVGAVIANTMFFSSLPEVQEKRRQGSLGEFNPLPMPIILGNTIGWTVYSLLTRNPYVAAANVPGVMLAAWYVLTTTRLADERTAQRLELVSLAMAAIHLSVVAGLLPAVLRACASRLRQAPRRELLRLPPL